MRDRAQLAKKITGDKNEMDILEKNKQFIKIISEINNILIQLKKISISGYPNIIKVKINIKDYKSSYECGSEKTYENIIKSLKEGLINLRKSQIKAYENYPLIRFIYGNQFNLIKRMDNDKIKPLLMYITRNNYRKL